MAVHGDLMSCKINSHHKLKKLRVQQKYHHICLSEDDTFTLSIVITKIC